MPQRPQSRRRPPPRKPRGCPFPAAVLAIGLTAGLPASALAGDQPASPFDTTAAVSHEALGDTRGSGLGEMDAVGEMRLGVVLWDEVPGPPPRRPPPRQAGSGGSATAANAISLNVSTDFGPGG